MTSNHLPGSLSGLDHHSARGFRLTRQSAAELIATALLGIVALILIVVTVLGFIFGQAMRDASTYLARHQMESARDAAARAVEADSSNPYALSTFAGTSLRTGEFEVAQNAYKAMATLRRTRFAESQLGEATVLLSDPSTAGRPATLSSARSLLNDLRDDPDARVMLGQLALDQGEYEAARGHFEAALRGSDEAAAPSAQGAVVAYNGLGVAILTEPEARRDPQRIAEALAHFHTALAYRQPWVAPLINRDRTVSLWLRAASAEVDDRRQLRELLRDARALHGASLEEYADYDLRRYERTFWAEYVAVSGPGERGQIMMGRFAREPLEMNRRATLRPAVLDVQLAALAGGGTLEEANRLLRDAKEEFARMEYRWGERWATKVNRVVAKLRALQAGVREAGRSGQVRDLTSLLDELLEEEFERTPEKMQPALLTAYWVVLGEAAVEILGGGVDVPAVLEHVRSLYLFERLAEFEGDGAVSRWWLPFVEGHLAVLETSAESEPGDYDIAEITRLTEAAGQLAAHLPADVAPPLAQEVALPDAAENIVRLPGEVRFGEVATLIRLYERLLRDFATEVVQRVSDAKTEAEKETYRRSLVTLEAVRARLLGYLIATGSSTLDDRAVRDELNSAADRIRDARRHLED